MSRDASNYLILVEKILGKAKEVSRGAVGRPAAFDVVLALGIAQRGVLQSSVGDLGLWKGVAGALGLGVR